MESRCINIDWLEVFCMEDVNRFPMNAEYFQERGYVVHEREYGTRVYAEMFSIEDSKGNPFLEIRRHPLSDQAKDGGLFPKESCHIRLSNYACYIADPIGRLRTFLADNGYYLQKIFRIDICLDFTKFDFGDEPSRFIRRYIEGRYTKINQSNVAAHGKDTWERRQFNSLSWGAPKSMIGTKMYNKSLELAECNDKPYIRWAWYLAGLIHNPITGTCIGADGVVYKPDVWRVEFSIKSSTKKWFVIEDCNRHKRSQVYMPHTLDMYDTKEKLLTMFASLAHYYFHFKLFEEGVRKDRCKDKNLFKFSPNDTLYQPKGNVAAHSTTSKLDRLIKYLDEYKSDSMDFKTNEIIDQLLHILRSKQVYRFVGDSLTGEDVLILQRLIAEHVGDLNDSEKQQATNEIKTMVRSLFDEVW